MSLARQHSTRSLSRQHSTKSLVRQHSAMSLCPPLSDHSNMNDIEISDHGSLYHNSYHSCDAVEKYPNNCNEYWCDEEGFDSGESCKECDDCDDCDDFGDSDDDGGGFSSANIECSKVVDAREYVATVLNKLGNRHYEEGNFDAALKAYKEGLEIERKVLDEFHPNIVITLTNMGEIHKIRGDYQLALRSYREAYKIQRKQQSHGMNECDIDLRREICLTLMRVATIHFETKYYDKALKTYERILRIQREIVGENNDNDNDNVSDNEKSTCMDDKNDKNNLEVASTLNSIGLVLFKMKLYDYALAAFEESLILRTHILGPDEVSLAIILYNIGSVHVAIGDDDVALSYYNETVRVETAAFGNGHEDVALTLEHMGYMYQKRGEINVAIKHFMDAIRIYKTCVDKGDHDQTNKNGESSAKQELYLLIAQALNNIGNLYLQKGQTQDMVSTFSQAVQYYNKAGKENSVDELTICGLNYYALSKMHPESASAA